MSRVLEKLLIALANSDLSSKELSLALREERHYSPKDVERAISFVRQRTYERAAQAAAVLQSTESSARPWHEPDNQQKNRLKKVQDSGSEPFTRHVEQMLKSHPSNSVSTTASQLESSLKQAGLGKPSLPPYRKKDGVRKWLERLESAVPKTVIVHHLQRILSMSSSDQNSDWPLKPRQKT